MRAMRRNYFFTENFPILLVAGAADTIQINQAGLAVISSG